MVVLSLTNLVDLAYLGESTAREPLRRWALQRTTPRSPDRFGNAENSDLATFGAWNRFISRRPANGDKRKMRYVTVTRRLASGSFLPAFFPSGANFISSFHAPARRVVMATRPLCKQISSSMKPAFNHSSDARLQHLLAAQIQFTLRQSKPTCSMCLPQCWNILPSD